MKKIVTKNLLLTFLICSLIPICGYLGALTLQIYNAKRFQSDMVEIFRDTTIKEEYLTLESLCFSPSSIPDEKLKRAVLSECTQDQDLADFKTICLLVSIFILSGLILCAVSGWISHKNRLLHLVVFKFGIFACTVLICISVLANAGVLVAASYFIPVYFTGYYFPKLTGLLGIGAAIVVYKICMSLFTSLRATPLRVVGKRMYPSEQAKLWTFIRTVSSEAEVKCPDNIIIGLEPNFFVSEHAIQCLDGLCSGRTLYISSTIMELLTEEEFKAILLHEFGHFKGLDTLYSLHYSPIFKRLAVLDELLSTNSDNGFSKFGNISALPTQMILHFFNLSFRISHAQHNRTRENTADDLAIKLTSAKVFASALIKSTLAFELWNVLNEKIQEKAAEGKIYGNIPQTINDAYKNTDTTAIANLISNQTQTHPFDTHPATSDRITRNGLSISEIDLNPPSAASKSFIQNTISMEEELTYIRYVELGSKGLLDFEKLFGKQAS